MNKGIIQERTGYSWFRQWSPMWGISEDTGREWQNDPSLPPLPSIVKTFEFLFSSHSLLLFQLKVDCENIAGKNYEDLQKLGWWIFYKLVKF